MLTNPMIIIGVICALAGLVHVCFAGLLRLAVGEWDEVLRAFAIVGSASLGIGLVALLIGWVTS